MLGRTDRHSHGGTDRMTMRPAGTTFLLAGLAGLMIVAGCAERETVLEGERFDPRADLSASEPVEGGPPLVDTTNTLVNRAEPVGLPPVQGNADWAQRAGNARHLAPHASLSGAPVRVWTADVGAGNSRRSRITAAPVVAGGRVFTIDAESRVTAVSTGGGVLWSVSLTPDFDRTVLSGGGLAFGEGRLFVTTSYGEIVAMDPASGAVAWRQRVSSAITGAPTVDGGVVYAVGRDSSGWAVRADNGRVIWTVPGTPTPSAMIGSAAPAANGTAVMFPFASGQVLAVARDTGTPLWSSVLAGERRGRAYAGVSEITGDPVVAGAVTYVGNQSGRTVAVETETGKRLWTAKDGAYGPVLPVGNAVYLVNDEARLVRLDAATGETVWSVDMPYFLKDKPRKRQAITTHYGPVLAGGRLVVVSGDGLVRLFNPTDGAMVGTVEVPGGAASQPALAGGMLFVLGARGQLHAFR
jgi:outer membrane protein assembly factor BamB